MSFFFSVHFVLGQSARAAHAAAARMPDYPCDCLVGSAVHVHAVAEDVAARRGQHLHLRAPSDVPTGPPGARDVFAAGVDDAVRGALYGMMIGDALGAPLHWIYTWDACQRQKRELYNGGIAAYVTTHQGARAAHPDSGKYFVRCDPAAQPVDIFNGHAAAWSAPGTAYHATLPAGDNTLTARIVARLAAHVVDAGGLDMDAWLRAYAAMLVDGSSGGRGASAHHDTWVDETHRVFFRNVAAGAAPYEAGMDDVCLSGIALCVPLLLAYAANRDAAEVAVRCLSQLTHKAEDTVSQAMWWGDLLAGVLAGAAARGGDGSSAAPAPAAAPAQAPAAAAAPAAPAVPPAPVQALIHAAFATFAGGRMDLGDVLSRGLRDEQAYHGPQLVFSSR